MTMLGAVTLSDFLRLENYSNRPLRAGSVRYLSGGGYVDQSQPLSGGFLYLTGTSDGNRLFGFFTGEQVEAINGLRASRETVDFVHHLGQWRVKVDAVDVAPRQKRAAPDGTAIYVGTVTLLIV